MTVIERFDRAVRLGRGLRLDPVDVLDLWTHTTKAAVDAVGLATADAETRRNRAVLIALSVGIAIGGAAASAGVWLGGVL